MAFFQGRHVPKITVDWTNARGYHAGHGNFTEFWPFYLLIIVYFMKILVSVLWKIRLAVLWKIRLSKWPLKLAGLLKVLHNILPLWCPHYWKEFDSHNAKLYYSVVQNVIHIAWVNGKWNREAAFITLVFVEQNVVAYPKLDTPASRHPWRPLKQRL